MRLVLSVVIAATLAGACGLSAQTQRPQDHPVPAGASDIVRLSKPPHPACRAWNDGCVSCVSDDGRTASCTDINVPGACTPLGIVCTREAERSRD